MTIIRRVKEFFISEFGFSHEGEQYKLFRIYFLVAALFSPLLIFFLFYNNLRNANNILFDIALPIIFLAALVLSFFSEWVKKNITILFFTIASLATVYACYNVYTGGYYLENLVGFLLAFFSISIGIQDHRYSIVYTCLTLLTICVLDILFLDNLVSVHQLILLTFIIGTVCFIIHYNRFLLIKKLNDSKEEVAASRNRLLTVIESINVVVYHVSIDEKGIKTLRYVSSKIQEILGISIEDYFTEIKSGRIIDRVHPQDLPHVIEQSRILHNNKKPVSYIYRYRKNDNYIWLEEKVAPRFDDNGRHIANIGISADVSNRIDNELALKKSEERYRTMIERNLAGFYKVNMNNYVVDCNDSFAKILGFRDKTEVIGNKVNQLYIESSDKSNLLDLLKEHYHIKNHESKVKLVSGGEVWLLENVSLVIGRDGEPESMEGTVFDITEFKNTQLHAKHIQENLELVINNISSLVYSIDVHDDGRKEFNFLGPQIESILGIKRDTYIREVQDGSIQKRFHPEDFKLLKEQTEIIKKERKPALFTYRFWSEAKNDHIWLEENMFPQYNHEGKVYKNFGVVTDVSDKIRYEEALKKSEENYRKLFERNLAGVFKTTISGKILDCNDAFIRIFGYDSKEELMEASSQEFYLKEKDRTSYLNDLREKNILTNYEICMRRKDDSKVWVLANVSLFFDDELNEEILLGTLINITELKITSEALAENEQKFRLLFEVANDAILILYNDHIIDCNNRSLSVFDCKREELLGATLFDFSPEKQPDGCSSREKLVNIFTEVSQNKSQHFYWRNSNKKGQPFDSEISLNQFTMSDKVFYQVIVRDVTDRVQAENALKDSEERFRLLSNSTIEGITFSDEEGFIVDCNDQFAILHGLESGNQVVGKNLKEFIYNEEVSVFFNNLIDNNSELIEIRGVCCDGSIRWLDTKGKLIPYGEKNIYVSVFYDITDRKKIEEGLLKSKQAYERLVEGSPYGIFIHKDGSVLYANNAAFEIVGLNKDEFYPGKYSFYDFLLQEYVENSFERRNELLAGKDVPFIRIKVKDQDGNIIDVETKSQLISYNEELAIQTTVKNISVELQLEKEKMRAEIAEQTNKQLEEEIQHHKQTQRKLMEVQQYTQNIIGSSIDMIIATDINNKISEANPAALSTFGYIKEEIIGCSPGILYADEEEYKKVNNELDTNGHFSGEILNVRKNGEVFTSYLSASPIKNNEGEIIGAMGVSRDISEIIEAEKIVQEQNAKIKSIFENSSNLLIWTLDKDFRISSFNKNFKELISDKYGVEIFIGRDFMQGLREFIDKKVFQKTYEKYVLAFEGKPQELEGPLLNRKGELYWFETYLNPIMLESGEIEEISCVSHDVTEKKHAQIQLRNSEERNKAMIRALPDLIYRINSKGIILDIIYKSEYQPTGSAESITGKNIRDHYPGDLGREFLENVRRAINENYVSQLEYEFKNKGSYEARFAQINEEEALVIIRDITEKKEAEENLLSSLKEKEVLLKEVHHRVKNNLQVISSILNLQSSYVKDENTLQILRESQNRIKSMSFIHESLYQTKNFSSINFSEYVINLSRNLVHSYQVYGNLIDLNFEVEEVSLNLDQAIPCGLIINELVSNALKYAFEEGVEGRIHICLSEKNGRIELSVEDNGKGLPEGFDYMLTETLGLQLVVTLVEQLDGSINLESKARKGTKYLITFEKLN